MASELKAPDTRNVHQALHGYSDGHRLLSCSTTLKPRDLKTILVMSDVSGPGAIIDDHGYITGYPLVESGLYALARTWAASEMPRPGCVWTHTLLVDFADLATLPDLTLLTHTFRRPTGPANPTNYESALTLGDRPSLPHRIDAAAYDMLRRLLWALYQFPNEGVVAWSDENTISEELVLGLWSQQWPRLRRAFRFCTLSYGDRSGDGIPFDLQFAPARERSLRSRFGRMIDVDRINPEGANWLKHTVDDISRGPEGDLRAFLRQVGGDVTGERGAFVPLCRLHLLLKDFGNRPTAIDEAVAFFEESFGKDHGNTIRTLIVGLAASQPEVIGERALSFLVDNLELLDATDLERNVKQIAARIWSRDPGAVHLLLNAGPPRSYVAESCFKDLSSCDLVKGLRKSQGLAPEILTRRPEIVEEPDFWTIPCPYQGEGFAGITREPDHLDAALRAMLDAKRDDLSTEVVRRFGARQVLRAVAAYRGMSTSDDLSAPVLAWLEAAMIENAQVAEALSSGILRDTATLAAIARHTKPVFVPNEFGDDPWLIAIQNSQGHVSDPEQQYLSAYLLARALGYCSRNQAELIAHVFDTVYFAAFRSKLTDEAWKVVEPSLPWVMPWSDWDRCQRLRNAVVDVFVDRDLWPKAFCRITEDDELFAQLAEIAGEDWRGRRFLKKVRQALEETASNEPSKRLEIIKQVE